MPPPASGFEALIPSYGTGREDFFFSQWIADPEQAADYLERGGELDDSLLAGLRRGVWISAVAHVLFLAFLLFAPSLDRLLSDGEPDVLVAEERPDPLVFFFEPPQAEPEPQPEELVLVPATPAEPAPESDEPPQVADNRLLIPKALLPPDERQDFMNDLPFSRGNTEEFYTDEEVEEPGEEGSTEPVEPETPELAPLEAGEDDRFEEASEGDERANDGTDVADGRIDPRALGDILAGLPGRHEEARPPRAIPRPEPPPPSERRGEGGENGELTDIRRFLAGARFHNPEGGLVSNTNNTLYYNDRGANFVPWIRRLLSEVRRGWIVPYSVTFQHGHVAIGITVARDGTITNLQMLIPSGSSGFDNAADGAIRSAQGRLLPLPADYPDPTFDIILVFWYNERPYDIFG